MAKSRGRKFAEITSPTSGVFDLTSVPTITNAKLQNSAMTLAGSSVSLGGTGVADTDALSEGSSNLYFTNARVQSFLGGGTLAGNIVVPDNRSIYVGSSSDFRIVHNTTNTQLVNATGALQITSNGGFDVTGAATFSSTGTFAGNILPSADSTHDIGTSANRFANAYFDTMYGTVGTVAQPNITSLGTLSTLAVNSGTTNISATFTSTDGLGGIQLADNSGNVELVANGNNFEVRNGPSGAAAKLTIASTGAATFTGNIGLETSANPTITVLETGAGGVTVQGTGSGGRVYSNSGQSLLLGAGGQNTHLAISSNGRVSIGDTSTSANNLRLVNASSTELDFVCSNGKNFRLQSTNASAFSIIDKDASNANRFHIDTNGKIGIGESSPSAKLEISGNSDVSDEDCMLIINDNDSSAGSRVPAIMFTGTGGNHGRIRGTDTQGIILSGSSGMGDDLVVQSDKVGIGVIPPAHSGLGEILSVNTANLVGVGTSGAYVGYNMYFNSGNWKYQIGGGGSALLTFANSGDFSLRQATTGSSAGDTISYSETFKVQRSTGYAELRGASDVRLTIGSTGTVATNSSNWLRAAGSNLMYNTPGIHKWEVSGGLRMQLNSDGKLTLGTGSTNEAVRIISTGGTLVTEAATSKNHRIIQRGYQDASGNITGNANYTEFYEYGSYAWYTNVNTAGNSRTYGMALYDNNLKIGDHSYNSTSGVIHYGGTGRTFMDMSYNSYGAEIILVNNRTASGVCSLLQYRTNSNTEGSVRGNANGLEFHNNSDYRKKKDIRDLTGSLDVITSLQPRLYKYKEGFGKPTRDFVGFIAHEIQEKMPNLVDVEKDALYTQQDIDDGATAVKVGDPKYQTVSYAANEMITRLVGAIQEQQALIEALQAEVKALKGE